MTNTPENETKPRRSRRRGAGEGTISRHISGMWRGRLMVGRKPEGKPDIREVYGQTRAEVQQKLQALQRLVQQGGVTGRHALTVAELLEQWLQDCAARGLRQKTLASYRQIVHSYLAPGLGRIKVADLRPEHIRKFLADLTGLKLSPATVRYARTLLHGALRLAMAMDVVGRNVTDPVRPPRYRRPEVHPPAPADVAKLLDAAVNDRLMALWTLAVYSGCRPGELLALRWQDIDWKIGHLAIRHTLTKVDGAPAVIAEPKTARGRRTVNLPSDAMDALRQHRQRQLEERHLLGTEYQNANLVFCSHTGTPLQQRNVVRSFKRLLLHAGMSKTIRLYDLRHAHATALLAAGVHPKVASERLGHASVSLTLDTYTHSVQGLDADAAARVQRAIRGPVDGDPPEGVAEEKQDPG
ncbi:MAG: site-specific integrase [Chloroflexota bacterium]